jgi:hypothetical protein
VKFWDSSAVVPLLVEQGASKAMLSLYRADPSLVVWWGTRVECDSAVARLERSGDLTPAQTNAALRRLDRLCESWQEVQPGDALRETARRLLRAHALRASDAMQLAAALAAAEQRPSTLDLVALDERLLVAAQREGFPTTGVSTG